MTEPDWKPITDDQRDGAYYIVGVSVGTALVIRNAWWDDGGHWDRLGFDRQQELRGWWAHDDDGERLRLDGPHRPTHWLVRTPPLPAPLPE